MSKLSKKERHRIIERLMEGETLLSLAREYSVDKEAIRLTFVRQIGMNVIAWRKFIRRSEGIKKGLRERSPGVNYVTE